MFNKLKEKVKVMKQELSVLLIAYKDRRTPLLPKLILALTIGYMLSPIDLIPDFIPVLGMLDDIIIVPLLIKASVKLIPEHILEDARKQAATIPPDKRKANWIGAVVIVVIWIVVVVFVYKRVVGS